MGKSYFNVRKQWPAKKKNFFLSLSIYFYKELSQYEIIFCSFLFSISFHFFFAFKEILSASYDYFLLWIFFSYVYEKLGLFWFEPTLNINAEFNYPSRHCNMKRCFKQIMSFLSFTRLFLNPKIEITELSIEFDIAVFKSFSKEKGPWPTCFVYKGFMEVENRME